MIETKRLVIRDVMMEDKLSYIEMAEEGSLNDCGFDTECRSWITEWIINAQKVSLRNDPTKDWLAYSIVLKEENRVIGSIGCSYYDDLDKVGITYFIGAEYRGKGYATEAVNSYLRYFFSNYHVDEIIATIREENVASWRAIEKTDFKLVEKKMYQDINDEKPELYRFYTMVK